MEIKKQDNGLVTFQLNLPWKDIQTTYQQLLAQTAKQIEIKGFRKGKAPLSLVEKQIDSTKLYGRAVEKLLPPIYTKVVQEHKLKPLTDPKITPLEAKPNQTWTFKVELAERPKIDLGNYQTYLKSALKNYQPKTKPKKQTKTKQDQHQHDHDEEKLKLIFDTLLKNAKIEICDLLIEAEYKSALSRLINQLAPLKITLEDYAKSLKKSVKDLVEDYKKSAQENLKLEFILSEIVQQENPPISEEEIDKFKPQPHERAYLKYNLQKHQVIDKLLKL